MRNFEKIANSLTKMTFFPYGGISKKISMVYIFELVNIG